MAAKTEKAKLTLATSPAQLLAATGVKDPRLQLRLVTQLTSALCLRYPSGEGRLVG
ncbi:hypothetical protein [Mesorhizobium australicum]|uniref:Uncharacterized protein n=1 Tax=Mesorhizobium australicum TaxID=536018 RepID=A0A1X7NSX5_9HYPH|nr:hypothetical protein [Mesorhizobium australicum]SMH40797.1 hypothetical protein SAMN02982922_2429 [Mesorhizobium australicum]